MGSLRQGIAIAWLAAACCLLTAEASLAQAVTVRVDGLTRHQTMDGFGSSERVFDDPHVFDKADPATGRALPAMTTAQEDEILDRLYRDLRLTRVRAAGPDGGGIEPVNDNADPRVTDLTRFAFGWKLLDDHCDLFGRARQRGATTFYLSPLTRESWMGTSTAGGDVEEYAEWLLAQVRRCAQRGVRLPYLSVANEPTAPLYNNMGAAFVREVIKVLGPRLRAEGFGTLFVVPDDVRPSAAAQVGEVVLSDPAARAYVGALATHLYGEPLSAVAQAKAVADRYGLPLWMTEFYQRALPEAGLPADPFAWARMMHALISTYDVSAIDYMWGFFGSWVGDDQLIALHETAGVYTGYTLRKVYFLMGQFSRFVAPGAVRIAAQPSGSSADVTAFLRGNTLTIVAVNDSAGAQPLSFELRGLPPIARVLPIRTSETENWSTLSPVEVRESSFGATLPPRSVTTFVSAPTTGASPPSPARRSQPPANAQLADVTPPELSGLRLSPRRFHARETSARRTVRTGTTISFRLSEPAAATLRFRRAIPGRRVGRRCVASRRAAGRRRCTRLVPLRSSLALAGRRGINRLRFDGRLPGGRRLRAGRYRLTAFAEDRAGNQARARRADFVVVPSPRTR